MGAIRLLKDLLKAKADIHATDKHQHTALNWCARKNQNTLAQDLISLGADINHQDGNTEYSSLMWASMKGYLSIVATCVKAGANLNLQDRVSHE